VALAIASATLPVHNEAFAPRNLFQWSKVVVAAVFMGILVAAVAAIPKAEDPLASKATPSSGSHRNAEQPPAESDEDNGPAPSATQSGSDIFLVINSDAVKEMTAPFEACTDSQAANQKALRIQDGKGTPPDGQEPAMEFGGAVFAFEMPAEATCKIWLRVWWDGSCGNTMNIKVDDEPRSATVGNDGTYRTWHWMEAPKTYKLAGGAHSITLLNREDGIMFDQMLITNDMGYVPQGIEE
jgi:hypothetical protein